MKDALVGVGFVLAPVLGIALCLHLEDRKVERLRPKPQCVTLSREQSALLDQILKEHLEFLRERNERLYQLNMRGVPPRADKPEPWTEEWK